MKGTQIYGTGSRYSKGLVDMFLWYNGKQKSRKTHWDTKPKEGQKGTLGLYEM